MNFERNTEFKAMLLRWYQQNLLPSDAGEQEWRRLLDFLVKNSVFAEKASFRITENKPEFYSNWAKNSNQNKTYFFKKKILFLHITVKTVWLSILKQHVFLKCNLALFLNTYFKSLKIQTSFKFAHNWSLGGFFVWKRKSRNT